MSSDIETLTMYAVLCLLFAAFFTTLFPILYAFSPWYRSALGRALMMQGISFALVLDITLAFQFKLINTENILILFWIQALALTYVAVASAMLVWVLLKANHTRTKERKHVQAREQEPGQQRDVRRPQAGR